MNNWRIWKQENEYQKLFWSGVVNGIGSRFTQVAVLALIYQITESGFAIGLLFLVRLLPYLIVAPIGGVLADRFSKKLILMTCELSRIPVVLTLLLVNEANDLWLVYFSSFVLALGEAIYGPTRRATLPALVKQERLLYVNAIEQVIMGVVLIVGSTTGGLISYLLGMNMAFILNAVTFCLSAIFIFNVNMPPNTDEPAITKNLEQALPYKAFFRSPILFTFIFICFTMPIANGIDNVLMSIYALEVFQMGELGVGLIYGCLGVGLVLSSFFSDWLKGKLVPITVIFIALEGIGHIFLSLSPTFVIALLSVIFITFVGGISNISFDTIVMKTVPKSKQGTFFGLTEMINNVTLGIFIAAGGLLVEWVEPRTLGALVGVLYMGFTVIYGMMFKRVNLVREKRRLKVLLN